MDPLENDAVIGGLRLHYFEWNKEELAPAVCIHGFTGNGSSFDALAAGLPARHVYAPDLRGHGDSGWSQDHSYGLNDYVADMEGLVAAWGLTTFALIGTSLGGFIAMRFTARHPEMVTALVINDIGPEDVPEQVEIMRSRRDIILQDFASFEAAKAAVGAQTGGRFSDQQVAARTRALFRHTRDDRWARKMDPGLLDHRFTQPLLDRPLWDELRLITCPTMVVWGMDSVWLSREHAHRMVEIIPHAELVPLPGVPHAPSLLEPAANEAILRLLRV